MGKEHFFLELEPPEERLRRAPHVVIIGGGFAGVRACKALANTADSIGCELDKGGESLWNQTSPLPAIPKSESLETSAPIGTQPSRHPYLAWPAQLRKPADLLAKTSLH